MGRGWLDEETGSRSVDEEGALTLEAPFSRVRVRVIHEV